MRDPGDGGSWWRATLGTLAGRWDPERGDGQRGSCAWLLLGGVSGAPRSTPIDISGTGSRPPGLKLKEGYLETMDTMERGDASGARRKGIVRVLHPNQIPGPQSQLMVTKKVEAGLQDLVQPLCHTVGLGVAS